jgi:alkanesulfonate monooxygenase SsuD/methylene tetrahydromethanopterin reductase-like flavin-dependent oxidoreductase (luciferase family)
MNIGVNLHNHGRFASKPAIDAIALRAEALGYDSIWTADHILVPRTEPEPFGQLLETPRTSSSNTSTISSGSPPKSVLWSLLLARSSARRSTDERKGPSRANGHQ